ncbi:MAG: acyl-CoA dehydrogenase family protein [Clostridia bacterium]
MHSSIIGREYDIQYNDFKEFTRGNIEPYANQWDTEECLPGNIIKACAEKGYLGALISKEYGGLEWDCVTYGLFNEAVGRGSISMTGLFNVHTMVAQTLQKWGTEPQKRRWLEPMAKGEILGAFALTEPDAGSDIKAIKTEYKWDGDRLILNGKKRWITFAGIADIFLVFGMIDGKPLACIVERDNPGLNIIPVKNMLGFRAAHLAVMEFKDYEVKKENIIGKEGFAFSHIAPYALEYGRLSVAWAGLGLLRACLETCGEYALRRKTFGSLLIDHSIIGKFITDMGVDHEAASLLCYNASKVKDEHLPEATEKIMYAKYFTSGAAARHSSNAVQIMGALGCNESFSVSRYYRDAKVLGIIEGSNEIHQMILGKSFARKSIEREKR